MARVILGVDVRCEAWLVRFIRHTYYNNVLVTIFVPWSATVLGYVFAAFSLAGLALVPAAIHKTHSTPGIAVRIAINHNNPEIPRVVPSST